MAEVQHKPAFYSLTHQPQIGQASFSIATKHVLSNLATWLPPQSPSISLFVCLTISHHFQSDLYYSTSLSKSAYTRLLCRLLPCLSKPMLHPPQLGRPSYLRILKRNVKKAPRRYESPLLRKGLASRLLSVWQHPSEHLSRDSENWEGVRRSSFVQGRSRLDHGTRAAMCQSWPHRLHRARFILIVNGKAAGVDG